MPTTSQRSSQAAAAPRAKTPRKKAPPAAKPFLRFSFSPSLRDKTLSVLSTLEKAKDKKQHRGALAEIVVELTDGGMDYYFLRPLKQANAGFFVEQSAKLGLAGTTTVMASVIRNVIGGMDGPQLVSVCRSIRDLMK